jgi:membrane-associated protease RseP (regulator of RpoE activity)
MTSSHNDLPRDHEQLQACSDRSVELWPAAAGPVVLDVDDGGYPQGHRKVLVPILLFLATCLSTFTLGAIECHHHARGTPLLACLLEGWTSGVQYMAAVMAILLAHEMGHFFQAVRHGIPASLPFFIPAPIPPIGTMGAVMGMQGSRADRRQLFDIGITGPLAGLALAIPIAAFGISSADVVAPIPHAEALVLQDPLVFKPFIHWLHPTIPPGHDLELNPLLLAGWVGMLITGLNMMPISQLDGGHVAYALLGRRAHLLARLVLLSAVVFVLMSGQYGWSVMLALVVYIGPNHPPTADDDAPLGWGRRLVGLASLAIPILCFVPIPAKVLS